jgi:cysteine desulfurase
MGRFSTEEEVDHVLGQVRTQVERLRELSPLWDMFKEGIDLKSVKWAAH